MSLFNTINFLPPAFRSVTNQRFLNATMDQLFSPAANIPVNGYIGRRFAPTYKLTDNYVPEQYAARQNYQLEPSVVVTDNNQNVVFNTGYIDFLNGVANRYGLINNHQRLTESETYNYDGHFDYDKFVNYYNYYWLPDGPSAVNVYANQVPYQRDFTVVRNTNINGYTFSGVGTHPNLNLTLARGGTYTFKVDQPGVPFWIQSQPGVTGTDPNVPTINTRNVFGVINNGTDNGTITFKVPLATAQDFYTTMPIVTTVDAMVTFSYTSIQNRLLTDFLREFPSGVDGLSSLTNKTIIFNNGLIDDSYWTVAGIPNLPSTIPTATRVSAWKITLTNGTSSDSKIILQPVVTVSPKQKVFVKSGNTYASTQYWVNNNYQFETVPEITSPNDYLYYQDGSNPDFVGTIKLVNNNSSTIDIANDILGKVSYTSPNGVIFTNGLKIQFDTLVTPSSYATRQFYVDGVGAAITLSAVDQLVVPESFGEELSTTQDYITINRGSQDLNPWSRSNRWFHKDVITATAAYNTTTADYGPNMPGRRPIIEFESNLQLFQYGKQAKNSVDLIVGVNSTDPVTDAFNQIEGQQISVLDGVQLTPGMRIIFAKDYDTNIINEVWEVTVPTINSFNYINLVQTVDDPVQTGQHVLITNGSHKGKVYYFDGTHWNLSQAKTGFNQPPLFDLVDADGYSFGDTTVYPGSTFTGNKFFGYPDDATGTNDAVLGFPLTYQNFNNIGDILFTNYYDAGSTVTPADFTYTVNQTSTTVNFNSGYLYKLNGLTSGTTLNAWIKTINPTEQCQITTQFYNGQLIDVGGTNFAYVQIDVLPVAQTTVPRLKVYINNTLLVEGADYTVAAVGVYYVVLFSAAPATGDKIDISIFSNSVSQFGYYEIPENLNYNPLNENFNTITLGQLRNHYNKLIENTSLNTIPLQDSYIKAQGGTLFQHSSPLIYAMTFLNDSTVNFVNGLQLAQKEYAKFKNKFLSLCNSLSTINYSDPVTGVDTILQSINAIKNSTFPWYYSDMVPQGSSYTTLNYTVLNVNQKNYEISSIFNNAQLSNRAVLVWVNGVQQTFGIDYTFSALSPAIIFSRSFVVGDKILIRDYFNTDGNYIPETPTKLGLYPTFTPEMYLDNTYQTPIMVIRGHDGSITPAFGDFRDDYLLELELRIFNNIKSDYSKNKIDLYDVIPGRFRANEYSLDEYNSVLAQTFLAWAGTNKLNYTDNTSYDSSNPWTWNYSKIPDVVDKTYLQGSWRAIYNYWFDTDTPNITPWVMLGFSSQPSWWENRYGPAPYTSGNELLWEDLAAGYIWNDGTPYTDARFIRPNLVNYIPVDSAGNLKSPDTIPLVAVHDNSNTGLSFTIGEQGPVETAWRRSSDYPFSLQLAVALLKPAEYFSTKIDNSRFYTNTATGQFSTAQNQKINPSLIVVNGDTTTGSVRRASGYLNWIADSIKNLGIDPVTKINSYLSNFLVKLNYKVGGFTDKSLITVSAEQTTPSSTNASVIIPDTNYQLYLNKSVPVAQVTYSAVIVEKSNNGFTVTGYNTNNPFFTILPSIVDNRTTAITVGNSTVQVYQNSDSTPMMIPYGTEFTSVQQTVDFLVSYERFLVQQGFVFNVQSSDLQQTQNWLLSVQEFAYWAQQGWGIGNILVLNPITNQLTLNTKGTVVDEITNLSNQGKVLDQNFAPIKNNNFNVVRFENAVNGNTFQITAVNNANICFAEFYLVQFEHVVIFDNVSQFGDILYVPSQGTRQYRLKLAGSKSGFWSGALTAAGYVYNTPYIPSWKTGTDYRTGDIVLYNGFYYTATQNIVASQTFNRVLWTQIDKSAIKTGLLPSFGLNADEFINFYDIDKPPTNEQFQEYSAGLIGFRQRQYLTDLGVSLPTQTKFYQGFIKEKGSLNSITALTNASFNNVSGNISVYEEWAFKVGSYGGVNSEVFKEFILHQSVFNTNPVALTSSNFYSTGNAIVNLNGNAMSMDINGNLNSNVYNTSNLYTTTTSIYLDRVTDNYSTDLPGTGYINANDVDYQIFDVNNFTANVAHIGIGDKIWIAKNATSDWGIYRVSETDVKAIRITYGLDSYAAITFDKPYNFAKGDTVIIKYFGGATDYQGSYSVDGAYTVYAAPSPVEVIIQITDPALLKYIIRVVTQNGNGTVYAVSSSRIPTINSLSTIYPVSGWIENDRVWVDSATSAGWGVYTYNSPWLSNAITKITANTVTNKSAFGSSVKSSSSQQYLYVGSPGARQVQVFANVNNNYNAATTIVSTDNKFGTAIDSHGTTLAIASNANVYIYSIDGTTVANTIRSANVTNISSISLSWDQHWLYVGDSTNNIVEAWYTANTTTPAYTWQNKITNTGSFGAVVKTNNNGNILIVSAPSVTTVSPRAGNVTVYSVYSSNSAIVRNYTITSSFHNDSAGFGSAFDVDGNFGNIYISSPGSTSSGYPNGVVERFTANATTGNLAAGTHQVIAHPKNEPGNFGSAIRVSQDGNLLAVGSQGSPSRETTTFDNTALTIDSATTKFIDEILNSGAVYLFEPIINQTITNDLGQYSFTQELETQVHAGDVYGSAIEVKSNLMIIGAPGSISSSGVAYIAKKNNYFKTWNLTRSQSPVVDIDSISRTFIYDKVDNNILAALDYIDPNKGKVLQIADADIDFKRVQDPAYYNQGSGAIYSDFAWGPEQVGKIWWNLDTVRFVSYEQDDLTYRLTNWGKLFPGSSIDVYEWVESTDLPSKYDTANGTPLHADNSAYCTYGYIDTAGNVRVKYYFWVKNRNIVNVAAGKRSSTYSIATAIENPQSQGIPYAEVLRNDTVALYNIGGVLRGQNSVLQLGSTIGKTNIVHSEYALVQEGNPQSQIPSALLDKLIDSLSGVDALGNVVPDSLLPVSQRYGTSVRPRQTMVINRSLAMYNYLSLVNPFLLSYPVVERKVLTILNSEEPIPNVAAGIYNLTIATREELAYVQTTDNSGNLLPAFASAGYTVLVLSDDTQNTKWTLYTWSGSAWQLVRVQSYKTNLYWSYADWYNGTFDATSTPDVTVANSLDLGKLTLVAGQYIKVSDAGNGKFAIYYVDDSLLLSLVGIESGTIQINTTTIPSLELRQILLAMQENIFIDDLSSELNKIFFTTIKYILTEQKNVDWMFKTSFLSATQNIRKLEEFPSYIPDNQNFYLDYITEVKPYRSIIREFIVDYQKNDEFGGDVTDFDLPAYWDSTQSVYRSPSGEQSYDANLLSQSGGVYSQWYNNYTYGVVDIIIENPGSGYTIAPQVIITGGGGSGAAGVALLNSDGTIAGVSITTPGTGYTSNPKILFNGTGAGASAYPVLRNVFTDNNTGHNLVRSIATTIKFDRTTYTNSNTFVFWSNLTSANVGQTISANTIIVLNDNLYTLNNTIVVDSSIDFPIGNVTQIAASDFDNANDRIVAYNGSVRLGSVFNGIDYPGVIVDGNTFVGSSVDSNIQNYYTNDVGVNPGDLIIDGGMYVDTFSSHAPEELVPGRMYDTLNMEVRDTNRLGYRVFDNMNANVSYYRISGSASTTLSANLNLTDTFIQVTNAAALPNPNREFIIPGVVFINGEKITYWRNYAHENPVAWTANTIIANDTLISYSGSTYLTTGNVFGWTFANITSNVTAININSLGHIRRAVDGTSAALVYYSGTPVRDSGLDQLVPNSYSSTTTLNSSYTYTTTDYTSLNIQVTAPINANIGDFITQVDANTLAVVSTIRVLETVSNTKNIPGILISNSLRGLPLLYDQGGFDESTFDPNTTYVYINGSPVIPTVGNTTLILGASVIGTVSDTGSITVSSGTTLTIGNIWYTRGVGTATTGTGLSNSTTEQAEFLLASRAY